MVFVELNNEGKFNTKVWKSGKGLSYLVDQSNRYQQFETKRKAENAGKRYYKENPSDQKEIENMAEIF